MKPISLVAAALVLVCSTLLSTPPAVADSFNVYRGQIALKELGYNPGPIDGVLGPATRDAIRQFQRDHGLAVTGQFNEATVIHLRRRTQRANQR